MTNNKILLPLSHPHTLTLRKATCIGVYKNGYRCDNCKKHSLSDFRMNCEGCQFDLCMPCFVAETNIQQDLQLPIHPHKLMKVTSILINCSLCQNTGNTYCWYCTDCKFYLCAPCFMKEYDNMKKIIEIPLHPHPLSLIPSRSVGIYQQGYRCDKCSKQAPTPLKWNCEACSFDLCETCFNVEVRKTNTINTTTTTANDELVLEDDAGSLCLVCQTVPRNATFVHQGTGHTVCCLECAKLVERTKKGCPVCRRTIDTVIQNFFG